MFCPNCNYKLDMDSKFCPNCGCNIEEQVVIDTSTDEDLRGFTHFYDKASNILNTILLDSIEIMTDLKSGIYIAYFVAVISDVISNYIIGSYYLRPMFVVLTSFLSVFVNYIVLKIITQYVAQKVGFRYMMSLSLRNEKNSLIMIAVATESIIMIALNIMGFGKLSILNIFVPMCIEVFSISAVFYNYFESKKEFILFSKKFFILYLLFNVILGVVVIGFVVAIIVSISGAVLDFTGLFNIINRFSLYI